MYNFNKINNCNFCKSTKTKHKYIGKRYNRSQGVFFKKKNKDVCTNIFKCKICKIIFSNPVPIPNNDFKRYEALKTDQMLNFDFNVFDKEIEIINKYIKKQNIKFLDIGCGNGFLINKLYKKNYDVYGLEPVKKFYDLCLNNFPHLKTKIKNQSIENCNFKNLQFDVISFNSVLEHIIDPSLQINNILNYLTNDGILHIEVPNSNWLISKLINVFKFITFQDNITNLSPMHPPYHYYEFSLETFKIHGENHGYEVVDYYFRVSDIDFNIPIFIKKILKFIMKKTNTGKQLVVFIKKL